MNTQSPIGIKKCTCGHEACTRYQLTGIGTWYQGTGFEKEDAELIADLLNKHRDSQLRDHEVAKASKQPVDSRKAFDKWVKFSSYLKEKTLASIVAKDFAFAAFCAGRDSKRESGCCTYCRGDGHEGQELCNRCNGTGVNNTLENGPQTAITEP